MKLDQVHNVYFIGIGGIGMSALARYFNAMRKNVAGYDKTSTVLTDKLQDEGMQVSFQDDEAQIDNLYQNNDGETLVIYTPAIPETNKVLSYFKDQGFTLFKRSEVLGLITESSYAVAVAGTHGKTTTSSIIAHMLHSSGMGCNAFLGGIATNYNSNLILNKESNISVVEADEFDRSFLKLSPDLAVVTSTDADHLDIYNKHDELLKSFQDFVDLVAPDGALILRYGLNLNHNNIVTYGFEQDADVRVENLDVKEGNYTFDVHTFLRTYKGVQVGLPGRHNIENALAAIAIAEIVGLSEEQIIDGLKSFNGVKRRFERIVEQEDVTYIDDYAHHPTELQMCINSVRELYPSKKVTGIFQPHLYSRTRDFVDEFATSLDLLDELILMDIYPAREMPIEGVTSDWLLSKVKSDNKKLIPADRIVEHVAESDLDVLLTLGAGDIDRLVEPIKHTLTNG